MKQRRISETNSDENTPCFSGASFVIAFQGESQQAFLEGHVAAFEFYGGSLSWSAMNMCRGTYS